MDKKKIVYLAAACVLTVILVVTVAARVNEKPADPSGTSGDILSADPTNDTVHSADPPHISAEPAPTPLPEPTPAPTPEPDPTPTPEPTPTIPDIDIGSWEYILANAQNPIGEYIPELTSLEGGQSFDSRAVGSLEDFIAAARSEGLSVFLSSSYRSYSEQSYLYTRKVAQYGGNEAVAATIVAPPGTSEHQTGLCCDITDKYYPTKDSSLEETELYKWMYANCAQYGFILRYPKDKEDVTGIIYEPWHFRYVGVEAAEYIMENGLCLEEFLELYE